MIEVIKDTKKSIPYWFLFRHFGVSETNFYHWKQRLEASHFVKKKEVLNLITRIFKDSKETYGSPRIYQELKSQGFSISKNTVAKYMKELGLDARLKKKYRIQTTDSNHKHPIASRLFKVEEEGCLPKAPGKLLAGDITYLRLGLSHVYLCVVLDLFNREVVGWAISKNLETNLVLRAMESAMHIVGPDAEIVFHSDRGSQYASRAYRNFLKNKNIKPSMSRSGNCYDNAYVESWFSSLKKEWIYRNTYNTLDQLKALIFEYIEIWYNKKRRHSSLGFLSPLEYKQFNQIGS
jgi:transposase InsO family protein